MARLPFKRHRFPGEVIRHAVWLYFRFTLSLRDAEELLASLGAEERERLIRHVRNTPYWLEEDDPYLQSRDGSDAID